MSETAFTPRFSDWDARVRASFARQGALTSIGAVIAALEPGRCSIALAFRPELTQQHGYFHAGITSMIADSAGGYAAYTLFPERSEVLTVEFKINLLAPAHGDELLAEGRVVRSGRTLTVCTAEVRARRAGRWTVCAVMQQTTMRVDA